nr:MAG TPA: hypothetical protein [Caudoviricetes sp.]
MTPRSSSTPTTTATRPAAFVGSLPTTSGTAAAAPALWPILPMLWLTTLRR